MVEFFGGKNQIKTLTVYSIIDFHFSQFIGALILPAQREYEINTGTILL